MEVTLTIDDEDEELTFEGFLDRKMEDVELGQAESVYTLACSCLQDRKNQRPLSKQVWRGRTHTPRVTSESPVSAPILNDPHHLCSEVSSALAAGSAGAERRCQKHFAGAAVTPRGHP